MNDKFPLTHDEFRTIYSKVPRATVEIVLKTPQGVYLTQRDIEPCKGQWHLPGGTVYFGESLEESVKRNAKRELGIDVLSAKNIGHIEYPGHYKQKIDHPIGLVFEATEFSGVPIINKEAKNAGWFLVVPDNMHADHDIFLRENGFLT